MISRLLLVMTAIGVCLPLVGGAAHADVVSLEPSKDNTLIEDAAGSRSNGAGPSFFVGMISQQTIRRGVVAFDVAGNIPTGSTINSVVLRLNMSAANGGPSTITLHRVLADWGEGTSSSGGGIGALATPGDATWLHTFYPTDFWSTTGGDFNPAVSGSQLVDVLGPYAFSSSGMVADVQSWLDDDSTNFGWLFRGDETVGPSAKRFDSRDNATPSLRPMLTIDFTAPCPCFGDMDSTGGIDGNDIDEFVECCVNGTPATSGCGCADLDENGVFELNDVSLFVTAILGGACS